VLIGVLAVAGYADDLQLSKEWLRAVAIGGPVWVGLIAYLLKRAMA